VGAGKEEAAGVDPAEVEGGARRLLAEARGHQLAETRKQYGLAQREISGRMGVSIARVSQIEPGEVASLNVTAPTLKRSAAGSTLLRTAATTPYACRPATAAVSTPHSRRASGPVALRLVQFHF
jgi:transcriptional regulator with XRE-family HTH domain